MQNIIIVNLFNDVGGGVRITLHIANILAEKGYKVRLIALSGLPIDTLDRIHGTSLAKYLWKNLYVKYLLDYQQSKYLLRFRLYVYQRYIKMLKEVIATYDPDIIVLFDDIPPIEWDSVKARVLLYSHFPYAARLLFNIYDYMDVDRAKPFSILRERVFRKFLLHKYFFVGNIKDLKKDIEVIANSTITSIFIKRVWDVDSKILFPFIAAPQSVSLKKPLSADLRSNIIVSLGVIAPGKRFGELIDAFNKVMQRIKNIRLVIMGSLVDKNYYKYLLRKIKRIGLENIFIITDVDEEKKWEILLRAKMYVHMKRFEPFGIAVAEAMYAGAIPIVYKGYTNGPWIDILDKGKYGMGFRTIEELVEAIYSVATLDKNQLGELQEKIFEKAHNFSLEVFKAKFIQLVEGGNK
ncbi:MAG: glycosyltransferase [Desulfurococcaceae archaeon]|nr:glycosyltransferase [Desulfurococcaceae archaeon]